MEPLVIDGSFGEGGGQMVRTSMTLSCITGIPFRIENIRSNRKRPGLGWQHLTAVKLLQDACNAQVKGLEKGSGVLEFAPGVMGDLTSSADVGTAGSISLILQALIPAVSVCGGEAKVSIRGGTDVLWSPTIQYTGRVVKEAYSRMGIDYTVNVRCRGYYPKGGGLVDVRISPCKSLKPIRLVGSGKHAELFCTYSRIPSERIEQSVHDVSGVLESAGFTVDSTIREEEARDAGGSLAVSMISQDCIAGADSLFDVKSGFKIEGMGSGVDVHLSDMLVIPASVADGTSVFRVGEISSHLETNLYVASKFTGCRYGIGKIDEGYEVRIEGNSDARIK